MSHAKLLFLLLPVLIQDDPIAAEAMKGYQHPWAGFGDGASITVKETVQQPDISPKGQLVYKPVVNEIKTTVQAASGERTTLKIEGGLQEAIIPFALALPNWSRGKGERKGTETLTVGGSPVECQVVQISLDTNKDAGQVTTICKSTAVPYWAVRWRTETLLQGRANTSEEELVLDVNQKVKVGDLELTCVLVQATVEAVGGAKTVKKEWRSDEIPGRVVKRETRQFLNGKEQESGFSQMEVVRFKGKR
jgi:hypothetical protein